MSHDFEGKIIVIKGKNFFHDFEKNKNENILSPATFFTQNTDFNLRYDRRSVIAVIIAI